MVPFWTTSAAENGGAISPAAKVWIWNLLSVASPTALANTSAPPCSVSSDFGKLVVRRHLISGIDCAMAGAAIVVAAAPMPAACNMLRRLSLVMTAILLLNPVGRQQAPRFYIALREENPWLERCQTSGFPARQRYSASRRRLSRRQRLPEPLPRKLGTAAKRRELGERDVPPHRRHPAIGAGHDFLLGNIFHRLADDGGHVLRRLHQVARNIDHADQDVLAVEQLEQVHRHTGIAAFDRDLVDAAPRQRRKDRLVLPPFGTERRLPVDVRL